VEGQHSYQCYGAQRQERPGKCEIQSLSWSAFAILPDKDHFCSSLGRKQWAYTHSDADVEQLRGHRRLDGNHIGEHGPWKGNVTQNLGKELTIVSRATGNKNITSFVQWVNPKD